MRLRRLRARPETSVGAYAARGFWRPKITTHAYILTRKSRPEWDCEAFLCCGARGGLGGHDHDTYPTGLRCSGPHARGRIPPDVVQSGPCPSTAAQGIPQANGWRNTHYHRAFGKARHTTLHEPLWRKKLVGSDFGCPGRYIKGKSIACRSWGSPVACKKFDQP